MLDINSLPRPAFWRMLQSQKHWLLVVAGHLRLLQKEKKHEIFSEHSGSAYMHVLQSNELIWAFFQQCWGQWSSLWSAGGWDASLGQGQTCFTCQHDFIIGSWTTIYIIWCLQHSWIFIFPFFPHLQLASVFFWKLKVCGTATQTDAQLRYLWLGCTQPRIHSDPKPNAQLIEASTCSRDHEGEAASCRPDTNADVWWAQNRETVQGQDEGCQIVLVILHPEEICFVLWRH